LYIFAVNCKSSQHDINSGFTKKKIFDLNLREAYGDERFEIDHAPLIADFDGDGKKDIFIAGGFGIIPMENNFGAGFMISVGPGNGPDWLMFQNDIHRRSNICDRMVSVKSPEKPSTISLSPNPASHQVLIHGNEINLSDASCQIFDAMGKKLDVATDSFSASEKGIIWTIDPSISPGIYVVQIMGKDFLKTKKLMVLK